MFLEKKIWIIRIFFIKELFFFISPFPHRLSGRINIIYIFKVFKNIFQSLYNYMHIPEHQIIAVSFSS